MAQHFLFALRACRLCLVGPDLDLLSTTRTAHWLGFWLTELFCSGTLEWTEIKPGATVYGEFSIENNGESGSLLDWEIESSPTWGTWTFIPSSGSDLAAGNMIMVNVTCVAPDEKPNEFTGNITIVNVENTSDYCVIPVYLKTPQITGVLFLQFLERFLVRFPNAFPRLRYILGC